MRVASLLAIALVAPALAFAQAHKQADAAMAALKRNDCPSALAALKQGMLDNEPASFYISGNVAETGTCAQADPAVAAKAYERAAALGRNDAAAALALLHAEGSGVPQSYAEAGRWYSIASKGMAGAPAAGTFQSPDAIAKTYTRAVHDLAYFELANRLKVPYPIPARVRFDPRTGAATIVSRQQDTLPGRISDAEILASYRDAVRDLPKPTLPATGDYATERAMGQPGD